MKLARYWAKGEIDRINIDPATAREAKFFCWGWSNESVAHAQEVGRKYAMAAAATLDRGEKPVRYTYGDKALRESVLREWKAADGTPYAAVTINSYGCDILNTTNVFFVDVDIDEKSARRQQETDALSRLDSVLATEFGLGARVYRTAAGMRYILCKPDAVPRDPTVRSLMERMGADPLYVKLCRIQDCFRAPHPEAMAVRRHPVQRQVPVGRNAGRTVCRNVASAVLAVGSPPCDVRMARVPGRCNSDARGRERTDRTA